MMNLLVRQATGPRIHAPPITNMTISGTLRNMTTRSAIARLMIIRLVTDCRILESLTITAMTSRLPAMPTKKMAEKRRERRTVPCKEVSLLGGPELLALGPRRACAKTVELSSMTRSGECAENVLWDREDFRRGVFRLVLKEKKGSVRRKDITIEKKSEKETT